MSEDTEFIVPKRPVSTLEIDGYPSLAAEVTTPKSIVFYSPKDQDWQHEGLKFRVHRTWVSTESIDGDQIRTMWKAYEYHGGNHLIVTNHGGVPGSTWLKTSPFVDTINKAIDKAAIQWIQDPRNQAYFCEADVARYYEEFDYVRSSIRALETSLAKLRKRFATVTPLLSSALAILPPERSLLWSAALVSQEHEGEPCPKNSKPRR